jgi:hypothetical protein
MPNLDDVMSDASPQLGDYVGPAAATAGATPPPYLGQQLQAAAPPVPNPVSTLGDYFANAGQVYADAIGAPNFRSAMVNDPLYKGSKAYFDNASRVFGGNGIDDNTVTDPNTGKVYPKGAAIPAPPEEPPDANAANGAGATTQDDSFPQPRLVTVPAHEVAKVDPKRQAEIDAANLAQQSAVTGQEGAVASQGIAKANAADVQAAAMKEEADLAKKQGEGDVARADERAANAEKDIGAHDRAWAELRAQKIDPLHYMNSRSTGQKILDAIGGMFGGFAAGAKGGPNQYLEHIQQLTANDIAAQKDNYENAAEGQRRQDTLWEHAYRVTGDKEEATRMAESLALGAAKQKTLAAVQGVQNPIILAQAAQAAAELEERRAALAGKGAQEKAAMNQWVPTQQVAVGGFGNQEFKHADKVVTLPGGGTVLAHTADMAKELQGHLQSNTRVNELAREALQLRKNSDAFIPGTAINRRLKSITSELPLAMKEPGVRFGESERELLENVTGNLTAPRIPGLGGIGVDENLSKVLRTRDKTLQDYVGSQHLPVVKLDYGVDPKTRQVIQTGGLVGRDYGAPAPPPGFKPVQ